MTIELIVAYGIAKVRRQHVVLLCVYREYRDHVDRLMGQEDPVVFFVVNVDEDFLDVVWLIALKLNMTIVCQRVPVLLQAL